MNRHYELCAVMLRGECAVRFQHTEPVAEALLTVAFKAANGHWMFTDEQDQFRGAIGAVLMWLGSGPEFERLADSALALGRLSAAINALQAGVPVDLEAMATAAEDRPTPIPLAKLWHEARA